MWLFWVVMFFYDLNWSMNCLLSGIILKLRRKEISRDHLVVFFFSISSLIFQLFSHFGSKFDLDFCIKIFFSCSFDFDLQVFDYFGKVFTWISQNMDTKFID